MNKAEKKEYMKKYVESHKEHLKKLQHKWYEKNKEEHMKKIKEWQDKNPQRVKEIKNKWKRKYRKSEKYQLDKERKKIQDYAYRNFRDLLIKKYGGCQMCKSKENLEIHHKEYIDDLKSVILLCRDCHLKIHKEMRELI